MINAKMAREVTDANILESLNTEILPQFLKKAETAINTFIQKEQYECFIALLPEEVKYEQKFREKLRSYGYTCKFIPEEFGDPMEPMDYGSPAYIKITW